MNCPRCGRLLPDQSRFCQYCGTVLTGANEPAGYAAPSRAPELAGRRCAYCGEPFSDSDTAVICSRCAQPHHWECWQYKGGCASFGCTGGIGRIIAPSAGAPTPIPYPQTPYTTLSETDTRILQGDLPVILEHVTLRKDGEGKLSAVCRFVSTADAAISAMEFDLLCADIWREKLDPVEKIALLDLRTKRDEPFGETLAIEIPDPKTRELEVVVQRVMLADGTLLTRNEDNLPIPDSRPLTRLLDEVQLKEYRDATVRGAKYVPEDLGRVWLCTCGALNRKEEGFCRRCGAPLTKLLDELDGEKLRERAEAKERARREREEQIKAAREEAERLRAEEEERARLEREEQQRLQREKEAQEAAEREPGTAESSQTGEEELQGTAEDDQAKKKKNRLVLLAAVTAAVALLAIIAAVCILPIGQWLGLPQKSESTPPPTPTPEESVLPSENLPAVEPAPAEEPPAEEPTAEEPTAEEPTAEQAEKERIYREAEQLAADGKIYEAATTFYTIKDYKYSWLRCFTLWGRIARRQTFNGSLAIKQDGTLDLSAVTYSGNAGKELYEFFSGLKGVAAVDSTFRSSSSAGHDKGCFFLMTDGTVRHFSTEKPANITSGAAPWQWWDIVSISCSAASCVGLKADGTVQAYSWGTAVKYGVTRGVENWTDIIQIAAGDYVTVGLKADGTVVAVGNVPYIDRQVSKWTDVVAVAAGDNHVIGVKSDGTVLTAGTEEHNELTGTRKWSGIVSVACTSNITYGLKQDGTIVSTSSALASKLARYSDIVAIDIQSSYALYALNSGGTLFRISDREGVVANGVKLPPS